MTASCAIRPVQANQFVVYNDYFEDVKNEKENCRKEPNGIADIGTTLRKEMIIHGRRANPHAVDASEQPNFSRPDSSRLPSADARPSLPSFPQPSFLRGRRNNWQPRQECSEKATLNSPLNCDTRSSHAKSPTKAGLPLRDAYRRELNEQSKVLQQRWPSNSQSSEPRRWHDSNTRAAGLKPCNEPPRIPPQFSVIGEEERMRIQSLCSPSLAQKMNVTDATHGHPHFHKPLNPQPLGPPKTKPSCNKSASKEPPPPYPFWSEAKAVSSSQHWQEHHPVDYRRSRACC